MIFFIIFCLILNYLIYISIKIYKLIINYNKFCCICLDNIRYNGIELKCNHIFHKNCIEEWKKYNNICPICRSS